MNKPKAIYVLGGMGPQASIELSRLLIEKAQRQYGAINNDDYPEVVIHSVPIPDFISNHDNEATACKMLAKIVGDIPDDHFGSFAICCNTAHILAGILELATKVPFVSMIDSVADETKRRGLKKVGLLASPTTLQTELYQKAFSVLDIEFILPDEDQLLVTETAIRSVLAGVDPTSVRSYIEPIVNDLTSMGAEIVILGCTELPLIFEHQEDRSLVLSSTECLADVLLASYYKQT